MPATVIRYDDHTLVPWKNGQGITREIAVARETDGRFLWRLSIATVDRTGPFSDFSGYDRIIMLLEGDGMVLDFGGHGRAVMAQPFVPQHFDGGWATHATLLGGPLTDFNVMTAKGRATAAVEVLSAGQEGIGLHHRETCTFFHVLAGAWDVTGYSLDGTLDDGDCLCVDGEPWQGRAIARSPDALLYRIAIAVNPPEGQ
jgi:environmental stress-induced protein Ves